MTIAMLILFTSDFGKFLNGYGLHNYQTVPEGWDWTGILVRCHQVAIQSFNAYYLPMTADRTLYLQVPARCNLRERRTSGVL